MKQEQERDLMLVLLGHALGQADRTCAAELSCGADKDIAMLADLVASGRSRRIWELCREMWGVDRGPSLIDAVRTRFDEAVTIRKIRSVSGKIEMAAAAGDLAKVSDLVLQAYTFCDTSSKENGK